jgi:hypothetical protein
MQTLLLPARTINQPRTKEMPKSQGIETVYRHPQKRFDQRKGPNIPERRFSPADYLCPRSPAPGNHLAFVSWLTASGRSLALH